MHVLEEAKEVKRLVNDDSVLPILSGMSDARAPPGRVNCEGCDKIESPADATGP